MTANDRSSCLSWQLAGDPEETISDFAEGQIFICECGSPEQQNDGWRHLYSPDAIDGKRDGQECGY
jgi:hypothetical protein